MRTPPTTTKLKRSCPCARRCGRSSQAWAAWWACWESLSGDDRSATPRRTDLSAWAGRRLLPRRGASHVPASASAWRAKAISSARHARQESQSPRPGLEIASGRNQSRLGRSGCRRRNACYRCRRRASTQRDRAPSLGWSFAVGLDTRRERPPQRRSRRPPSLDRSEGTSSPGWVAAEKPCTGPRDRRPKCIRPPSSPRQREREQTTHDCPVALPQRRLLALHPSSADEEVGPGVDESFFEYDLPADARPGVVLEGREILLHLLESSADLLAV